MDLAKRGIIEGEKKIKYIFPFDWLILEYNFPVLFQFYMQTIVNSLSMWWVLNKNPKKYM